MKVTAMNQLSKDNFQCCPSKDGFQIGFRSMLEMESVSTATFSLFLGRYCSSKSITSRSLL